MSIQNKIEPEEKFLNLLAKKLKRQLEHLSVGRVIILIEGLIETPKRVVKAYEEFLRL